MAIEDKGLHNNFRDTEDTSEDIFGAYPAAQWQAAGGDKLAFPIESVDETGDVRLVEHERVWVDGAKLDDTGLKATRWTFRCLFDNTLGAGANAEPNLSEINGGKTLYPTVLNLIIESFRIHETGDLTIPTRGTVRARADSWSRTESAENRDNAMVSFTFVEDNEDNVDAQSFTAPSASANAGILAETAEFSEQSDGAWDGSIQQLNELCNELEGLANAPGQYAQDLEQLANTIIYDVDRVVDAFSNPAIPGRDILLGAESTTSQRKLEQQKELAGKARTAAKQGQQQILSVTYDFQHSIFDIAVIEEQDAQTLVDINPQIPNLLVIPAKTPVRIFSDAAPTG